MKLKFDSEQDYQNQAVRSVIDIFEGQPLNKGDFEISFNTNSSSIAFSEKGVSNNLVLSDEQIIANIQKIQKRNKIDISAQLETCIYNNTNNETVSFKNNFTVEMETGTGKTYTYLRTIYKLNKTYGFKKFVIVVPSVAIREGAIKNLEITQEHFQDLYSNPPLNYSMYQSGKLGQLRSFATANSIQILVINIDSFTKDNNIINTVRETGIKPIEYIQAANPIVIVDEPQNMETDIRKAAIHNLNPLCTLRYSATHRNLYNLIYSLNPVQAYDLGLVKQIEVDGITTDTNYNAAFIHFKSISQTARSIKASLNIYVNDGAGVKQKLVKVGIGDDLYSLSNKRDIYSNGFILNSINAEDNYIEFSNGLIVYKGEKKGGLTDEIMKFQIERTIKTHFNKEQKLKDKGIKVLSLFFIDKVSNYRYYDNQGNPVKGKFALWFEELFNQYVPDDYPYTAQQVNNGYFSQDKKGKIKDTKGNTIADNDTYSLIMKEKERLLNPDEPLRFIFSHSALREGWDNPNVFQICTLNEARSDLRKRQEIGRGLRLPVNNLGHRIFDKSINILTVIANESYIDFSNQLQNEIESETSVKFTGRIKNARNKAKLKLSKELTKESFPLFFEIWERINNKTNYKVNYNTSDLIKNAVFEVKKMPKTTIPMLLAEKHKVNITKEGIEDKIIDIQRKKAKANNFLIPDIYNYVQSHVDITRNTIFEILQQSDRYNELLINPQMFLDNFVSSIKIALNKLLVDGIKYEKINNSKYSMQLFKDAEIELYLSNLFKVSNSKKTLYNYVPFDSQIENKFAQDCEADQNVKFFFKLPKKFKIPTPIGNYVPDWAVIFHNDKKIYFVVETKSTLNTELLRGVENMKIECGKKHFALFKKDNVEYKKVTKVKELY